MLVTRADQALDPFGQRRWVAPTPRERERAPNRVSDAHAPWHAKASTGRENPAAWPLPPRSQETNNRQKARNHGSTRKVSKHTQPQSPFGGVSGGQTNGHRECLCQVETVRPQFVRRRARRENELPHVTNKRSSDMKVAADHSHKTS